MIQSKSLLCENRFYGSFYDASWFTNCAQGMGCFSCQFSFLRWLYGRCVLSHTFYLNPCLLLTRKDNSGHTHWKKKGYPLLYDPSVLYLNLQASILLSPAWWEQPSLWRVPDRWSLYFYFIRMGELHFTIVFQFIIVFSLLPFLLLQLLFLINIASFILNIIQ